MKLACPQSRSRQLALCHDFLGGEEDMTVVQVKVPDHFRRGDASKTPQRTGMIVEDPSGE